MGKFAKAKLWFLSFKGNVHRLWLNQGRNLDFHLRWVKFSGPSSRSPVSAARLTAGIPHQMQQLRQEGTRDNLATPTPKADLGSREATRVVNVAMHCKKEAQLCSHGALPCTPLRCRQCSPLPETWLSEHSSGMQGIDGKTREAIKPRSWKSRLVYWTRRHRLLSSAHLEGNKLFHALGTNWAGSISAWIFCCVLV